MTLDLNNYKQVVRGQPSLQDLQCLRRQSERHWVILREMEGKKGNHLRGGNIRLIMLI